MNTPAYPNLPGVKTQKTKGRRGSTPVRLGYARFPRVTFNVKSPRRPCVHQYVPQPSWDLDASGKKEKDKTLTRLNRWTVVYARTYAPLPWVTFDAKSPRRT